MLMIIICFIALFACSALGALWRSRGSAWVYLTFAALCAIFALLSIVGAPWLAAASRALLCATGALLIGSLAAGIARQRIKRANEAVHTGSAKGDKRARSRNAKRALVVSALALLVLSAVGALVLAPRSSAALKGVEKTPAVARALSENILVCGVDNDPNDPYHQQKMTDVIAVVNLDLSAKRAAMLQIPRDTYVGDMTSTGKINAIYNLGESDGEGINALAKAINAQLALPIDHYATITMEGFRAAVDALGGVTVTLDRRMSFNYVDLDGNVTGTVVLEAGDNLLDGVTADLFVRYRDYARADLDRIDVQRYFFAGLAKRLSEASAGELISTVRAAYPYLNTDYSLVELIALALRYKGVSSADITMLSIPGESLTYNGQSVYSAHKEPLAELLNEYLRAHTGAVSAEELGIIELQNTTSWNDGEGSALSEYGA